MTLRATFLLLCLALCSQVRGATYYVATTGSDSNPGSVGSPWLTYSNAALHAVGGDTVFVLPGVYSRAANKNSELDGTAGCLLLSTAGTSNSYIAFRAIGPVTNQFWIWVSKPYYIFDGFTWDGSGAVFVMGPDHGITDNSGHVVFTNCTVQYAVDTACFGIDVPTTNAPSPTNTAGYCTVVHSTFNRLSCPSSGAACVSLNGVGNLVQDCVFENGLAADSIYLFGSNSVIRSCTFSNMVPVNGYGNHPDIMQNFGQKGFWCADMLFEKNYIVGCPIQLMQFEQIEYGGDPFVFGAPAYVTNNFLWGVTFRNNVVEDGTMQCSVGIPNVKFYNNTFRRCSSGITLEMYDRNWSGFRGVAEGAECYNNAFIDCPGQSYSVVPLGPIQNDLTNSVGTVKGRAAVWLSSDYQEAFGTYSGLTGSPTGGSVWGPNAGTIWTLDATNFVGGKFDVRSTSVTLGDVVWDDNNNNRLKLIINTAANPSGEVFASLFLYYLLIDPAGITNHCDFNYLGPAGEPNGVHSGDTKLAATNGSPATLAQPLSGSVLIDAGTNLTSLGVTVDFSGTARPYGGAFDIGAFEYAGGAAPSIPATIYGAKQVAYKTPGESVTFTVTPGVATAPLTYQWTFAGTNITGATTTALALTSLQVGQSGPYTITAANSAGSASQVDYLAVGYFTNGPLMELDFSTLTGSGVSDATGNGHTAKQFNATNNIYLTNGPLSYSAGQWDYRFTQNDGQGHTYPASQYLGVTNLTGFEYLTNATISLWAKIGPNSDSQMVMLGAHPSPGWQNSWYIGRQNGEWEMAFVVYPYFQSFRNVVYWPWSDANTATGYSTTNFHLYTVSVDCNADQAVAYYDGVAYMTNTVGVPWLQIKGGLVAPWLAIGTASQGGTPQWGDDLFPNSMYFVGKMADVRIYNRTLGATEVVALYGGYTPTNPPPPPPTNTVGTAWATNVNAVNFYLR